MWYQQKFGIDAMHGPCDPGLGIYPTETLRLLSNCGGVDFHDEVISQLGL